LIYLARPHKVQNFLKKLVILLDTALVLLGFICVDQDALSLKKDKLRLGRRKTVPLLGVQVTGMAESAS